MANRVRLTVVAALALLNVFALGAGVAVAALLPSRLALWQVPRVATVRIAAPAAVLTPAVSAGVLPTSQGLTSELAPLIASRSLGPHVGVVVTDLASGTGALRPGGQPPRRRPRPAPRWPPRWRRWPCSARPRASPPALSRAPRPAR